MVAASIGVKPTRENQFVNLKPRSHDRQENESSIWEFMLLVILIAMVFSTALRTNAAEAPAPAAKVSTKVAEQKPAESAYQGSAKFVIETSRVVNTDTDTESFAGWYQATFSGLHKPTNIGAKLVLGFSQEYSYDREDGTTNAFDNPLASVSKTWKSGADFKTKFVDTVALSLTGALPASREMTRRTFLGSLGPNIGVAKKFGRATVTQALGYVRSFYEYEIRDNGVVNSPDAFRSTTGLDLALTDALSLSTSLVYTYAVSFQGVGKATQITSLSADYAFTDHFSMSLGLATERGTLEPDGQTNRIKFYDPDTTQAFIDLVVDI
jgi:hypothetical protein